MKKILPVLLLLSLAFIKVDGQTTNFLSSSNGSVLDTAATGDLTKTFVLTSQVSSNFNIIEIQFTATKISGTVGGSVTIQESLDGTDWFTSPGVTAYTLTDATQTTGFKITNYGGRYLRIRTVGTGTMSAQLKAKLVARQVATK